MIATGLEQVFNNTNLFHYTSDPLETNPFIVKRDNCINILHVVLVKFMNMLTNKQWVLVTGKFVDKYMHTVRSEQLGMRVGK